MYKGARRALTVNGILFVLMSTFFYVGMEKTVWAAYYLIIVAAIICGIYWNDKIKNFYLDVRDVLSAFFGIKEKDGLEEEGKKVASTVIRRIIYGIADYWLAILWAAANVVLKVLNVPLGYAFVMLWLFSITIAGAFLMIYAKTGYDVTLGEDLRRAVDAIRTKSRIVGYISVIGVILQAVVWSGPEQVVIFFKKEIGSMFGMVMVMLFLTAIQSAFWMFLYRLGYDVLIG